MEEAKNTVNLWYSDRKEVLTWQEKRKAEAREKKCVHTLLGRARMFPSQESITGTQRGHIERAAINTPVQVSNLTLIFLSDPYCASISLLPWLT